MPIQADEVTIDGIAHAMQAVCTATFICDACKSFFFDEPCLRLGFQDLCWACYQKSRTVGGAANDN